MNKIPLYNIYLTRFAAGLAVACTLSVFLYGIFLLMAVSHTAARTAAQKQIQKIADTVEITETKYLVQQKELTPEYAAKLGFVKPDAVSTVLASGGVAVLTLNAIR